MTDINFWVSFTKEDIESERFKDLEDAMNYYMTNVSVGEERSEIIVRSYYGSDVVEEVKVYEDETNNSTRELNCPFGDFNSFKE